MGPKPSCKISTPFHRPRALGESSWQRWECVCVLKKERAEGEKGGGGVKKKKNEMEGMQVDKKKEMRRE